MRAIDLHHLGREKVICAWEVDGLLLDSGPHSTEDALVSALDGERPRALLTHIHFDRAGAAGAARTHDEEGFMAALHERIVARAGDEVAAVEQAAPLDRLFLGLERWHSKRQ